MSHTMKEIHTTRFVEVASLQHISQGVPGISCSSRLGEVLNRLLSREPNTGRIPSNQTVHSHAICFFLGLYYVARLTIEFLSCA
jgi:hypothetical protein